MLPITKGGENVSYDDAPKYQEIKFDKFEADLEPIDFGDDNEPEIYVALGDKPY